MSIRIPQHIAIIMDGNGRWAQRRGRPRVFGHVRGSSRVKPIILEADRLGVKVVTLYAFSTENWSRPETELSILWRLLAKYLRREVNELDQRNVRFSVIGEIERLPKWLRAIVDETVERLSDNTGMELVFAISYGSRSELVRASQRFAEDCAAGKRKPEEMTEELMQEYLWTSALGNLSEVDLLIRTSGEKRISNFLLWQSAYSELYFSEICWPDFEVRHFREAIEEYSNRERRFGGIAVADASSSSLLRSPHA